MSAEFLPANPELCEAFQQTVSAVGGKVTNVCDMDRLLFMRATFPKSDEVRPGDAVSSGVSLRAHADQIVVHPFVFRQVCRNGAVMATATDSRRIERVAFSAEQEEVNTVLEEVHACVLACKRGNSFERSVDQMRQAAATPANTRLLVEMLLAMADTPTALSEELIASIVLRFTREEDQTLFGMMNAVTSEARDTQDPELRWRLEELGGGVPAFVLPTVKPGDTAADVIRV